MYLLPFFFLFSSSDGSTTTRFDEIFDGFFHDAIRSTSYCSSIYGPRKVDWVFLLLPDRMIDTRIKHRNWPPISLLEGQEIVPQIEPRLLHPPEE